MELTLTLINMAYALVGAIMALLFMMLGYKLFDHLTPFETAKELANGNIAVGIVIGSIFVGLGIAIGLVVGLGLN